ncbi:MAG: hypothetical protein EXQ51_06700 [Acidobacteria bacterium]|nr:hypothetical protein [Acidobacteriota bacterium]
MFTRLSDVDFAEYLRLTVPYAAATDTDVPPQSPGLVGRLLQRGFLFVVAAARLKLDHPTMPRLTLRLRTFWLLAHVHGLAPPVDRVNVSALEGQHLDVNAPEIQPIAYHYLRASLESLGANERAVLDDVAVTLSYLNAGWPAAPTPCACSPARKPLPQRLQPLGNHGGRIDAGRLLNQPGQFVI